MRWVLFAVLAAALLAAGIAVAADQHHDVATGNVSTTVRTHVVPWQLVSVGPDGRTLRLGYDGGGCSRDDGRATVHELPDRIDITLRQGEVEAAHAGEDLACTLDLRKLQVAARLKRPIAGRVVEGAAPLYSGNHPDIERVIGHGHRRAVLVPRVVGLSAGDAVTLLLDQGLRPHLRGAGYVVAQEPSPGTVSLLSDSKRPRKTAVRVRLGRPTQ